MPNPSVPSGAPPWPHFSATHLETFATMVQDVRQTLDDAAAQAGNDLMYPCHRWLDPLATSLGQAVAPVAAHPFVQGLTQMPGLGWLLAALGQVNLDQVRQEIDGLHQAQPQASPRALAHQVVAHTALKAAGVSAVSHLVPPLPLLLAGIEVSAVAVLQAQMIYRIAALYGYSPEDGERRGEVFAIWLLSASASGLLKTGRGLMNPLPWLGAMVDVATDTTLVYSVGYWACRYYETKPAAPTEISL